MVRCFGFKSLRLQYWGEVLNIPNSTLSNVCDFFRNGHKKNAEKQWNQCLQRFIHNLLNDVKILQSIRLLSIYLILRFSTPTFYSG
jgi:hypothetical protein